MLFLNLSLRETLGQIQSVSVFIVQHTKMFVVRIVKNILMETVSIFVNSFPSGPAFKHPKIPPPQNPGMSLKVFLVTLPWHRHLMSQDSCCLVFISCHEQRLNSSENSFTFYGQTPEIM